MPGEPWVTTAFGCTLRLQNRGRHNGRPLPCAPWHMRSSKQAVLEIWTSHTVNKRLAGSATASAAKTILRSPVALRK